MKRSVLFLFLILAVFLPAAADRIAPTTDIGLFVDPDVFWEGLQRTPLYDYIYEHESFDYKPADDLIKSFTNYYIEGDAVIMCFINKYNKIHGIKIVIAPWYLVEDDCFEASQLTGFVLLASGLLVHDYDLGAVEAVKNNEKSFLSINYYLKRYIESDNLVIELRSFYDANHDFKDPYARMEIFEEPCDPAYVGACIPIVDYDLNCSDITDRNFFVIGKDKHHFDGDYNGVCCEPYPLQ